MVSPLQELAANEASGSIDLFGVGLVLAIVGCFLLANSLLFRHPRTLVADFFGARSRLSTIREYIFHRVQVHLGFLCLLFGFGLQLFGHYQGLSGTAAGEFPLLWVGVVALVLVALELIGWWVSHALFRRYVRQHFLENAPPDLERDVELARELGTLYGISTVGDDSVQSFTLRLRQRMGLPNAPRPGGRRALEDPEEEEELEFTS